MYPGVPVRVPTRLDPVELYIRVYSKGRLLVRDNFLSGIPQVFEYLMNLGKISWVSFNVLNIYQHTNH